MPLLEAIREASSPAVWSRAVELARAGAVTGEAERPDEIVLRVSVRGAPVAFTVHLWPQDQDWSCDCPSRDENCVHVGAAAIALRRAREKGSQLPGTEIGVGHVGYRLATVERGFALSRVAVFNNGDHPLAGTVVRPRGLPGRLLTDDADIAIETAVDHRFGGLVPRVRVPRLLRAMEEARDVSLDGEPVRTRGEPVLPVVRVEDRVPGFFVRLVRDPGISRVFENGCVVCEGVLRPIGEGDLSRDQRQLLIRGLSFSPDEVGKLVGETLPALRRHLPVDVRTRRLPAAGDDRPRIVLTTSRVGEALHVLPTLVYGDPPIARVDRGELTLLGERVPVRDQGAERRATRRLAEGLGLALGHRAEYTGARAVSLVERMTAFDAELSGRAWQGFKRAAPIQPSMRIDGCAVDLDMGGADPLRVLEAWTAGESLVPTELGWAPLPLDWLQRHGALVADILAARDPQTGQVARHGLFDLARLCEALDHPPPAELDELRALIDDFEGLTEPTLPPDLTATLRPYQRAGLSWLLFLRDAGLGGILADDMGLGKTLQALCTMQRRTLVVAPTSVMHAWREQAETFRPGLSINIFHGPGRKLDDSDLTITSYALLRLDIGRLSRRTWDTIVLDEAQAIKNPESQVARAASKLKAHWRLTMTGTPVENRLDELWSQCHFVNPGLLGGRRDFQERYARPISLGDASTAAHLRRRLKPFVLRRLKRDVAPELPARTEMVLNCQLSTSERDIYDAIRIAAREKAVAQLEAGRVMAALEALLRLRQACCHPGLVPGQDAESSSKIDLLMETLDEVRAAGHKALVFSQWTSLLDRVEPHLRAAEIEFLRLDGSTRDREGVVNRFQADDGPPVFLLSLKAGGTGLTLTAADHVFLLDPWWNPAVEDQAADRTHRIGQDKPVMIYRLVADDTVEERILGLQARKRAIAEAALGEAAGATAITKDDLLELLR